MDFSTFVYHLTDVDDLTQFVLDGPFRTYSLKDTTFSGTLNGTRYENIASTRVRILAHCSDNHQVFAGIMFITYCPQQNLIGTYVRTKHGDFGLGGWRKLVTA